MGGGAWNVHFSQFLTVFSLYSIRILDDFLTTNHGAGIEAGGLGIDGAGKTPAGNESLTTGHGSRLPYVWEEIEAQGSSRLTVNIRALKWATDWR